MKIRDRNMEDKRRKEQVKQMRQEEEMERFENNAYQRQQTR